MRRLYGQGVKAQLVSLSRGWAIAHLTQREKIFFIVTGDQALPRHFPRHIPGVSRDRSPH
jgi:hypothetical protein